MDPISVIGEIKEELEKRHSEYESLEYGSVGKCQFLDFQPQHLSFLTPLSPIKADMDFSTAMARQILFKTILNNFIERKQQLAFSSWKTVFEAIEHGMVALRTNHFDLAKVLLSLMLLGSRNSSDVLIDVANEIPSIVFVEYTTLPDMVVMVLTCENAKSAYREVNGVVGFSDRYVIPPRVAIVDGLSARAQIYGWVSFGNDVVVTKSNFPPSGVASWSPLQIMHISSIVGHETQQGLLRMAMDNYNAHSHDIFPPLDDEQMAESGFRWEKAMFFGSVIFWDEVRNERLAYPIVEVILNQIRTTGKFNLNANQIDALKSSFKEVEEGARGGAYYKTRKAFR